MEYPQFFHQMPINLLFANHLYILRNFYIYISYLYTYIWYLYTSIIYIYIIISICPGLAALSNSKNRPKFAVLRARHEAATSREAVGVTLDVCRRDLAKMGIFDKKKLWKWWWYAGYMEICWFYGVSSVYDIWRYMEICVITLSISHLICFFSC